MVRDIFSFQDAYFAEKTLIYITSSKNGFASGEFLTTCGSSLPFAPRCFVYVREKNTKISNIPQRVSNTSTRYFLRIEIYNQLADGCSYKSYNSRFHPSIFPPSLSLCYTTAWPHR